MTTRHRFSLLLALALSASAFTAPRDPAPAARAAYDRATPLLAAAN
ncbi:MAG: hypothetical protein HYV75_07315 [Opitutae bacterium]|nr:hypothetical protein [Opitutae bacterium]